ncbi:CBS domain-containing protein [Pontivivens ytuae]|uniref:CBS domain-containing protein n=1 Tax=Pontivivens ytuae TaxID=2789856 RepID=A0A7S9QB11_9RHOB|nr:CBS domain-containing protein [Pontivivens ytuae]QPH52373.1 CBS domain-containing protein [Pontivivens ytuae]
MKVKDAMHEGVQWCAPDTPLAEISKLMAQEDIGSVPIGEDDRLVGMVTDRDICLKAFGNGRDPAKLTARDVMHEGIVYCTTEEQIEDAVHLMESKGVRRLPVINDKKRMVGMLSLGDVSHAVSHELTGELTRAVSAHH